MFEGIDHCIYTRRIGQQKLFLDWALACASLTAFSPSDRYSVMRNVARLVIKSMCKCIGWTSLSVSGKYFRVIIFLPKSLSIMSLQMCLLNEHRLPSRLHNEKRCAALGNKSDEETSSIVSLAASTYVVTNDTLPETHREYRIWTTHCFCDNIILNHTSSKTAFCWMGMFMTNMAVQGPIICILHGIYGCIKILDTITWIYCCTKRDVGCLWQYIGRELTLVRAQLFCRKIAQDYMPVDGSLYVLCCCII